MNKIKFFSGLIVLCIGLSNCSDNEYRFIDLNSGKRINVIKDSTRGYMINAETKEPVGIYYDTKTKDTINGADGDVINNKVIKTPDGKYIIDEPKERDRKVLEANGVGDIKEGEDYKKKVQGDGDVKIKEGDTKIKIKANGDEKIKSDK